jgi:hypothetical protein
MSSAFTIRTCHLFSPTVLDHDLTYIDKAYYNVSPSHTALTESKLMKDKQ